MLTLEDPKRLISETLHNKSTFSEIAQTFMDIYSLKAMTGEQIEETLLTLLKRMWSNAELIKGHFHIDYRCAAHEADPLGDLMWAEKLQIEDSVITRDTGMLRIYLNGPLYLWVVFIRKPVTGEVEIVSSAITSFGFNGEGKSTAFSKTRDQLGVLYQTNFGNSLEVEYKEDSYSGFFKCIHPRVRIDDTELGFYSSLG